MGELDCSRCGNLRLFLMFKKDCDDAGTQSQNMGRDGSQKILSSPSIGA